MAQQGLNRVMLDPPSVCCSPGSSVPPRESRRIRRDLLAEGIRPSHGQCHSGNLLRAGSAIANSAGQVVTAARQA
jgi:hypothetical protein